MKPGSTATATTCLLLGGALLGSSPASAQANGDPGSALLGIARAQTHAVVEKRKEAATPPGQQGQGDPPATDAAKADATKSGKQSAANVAHHD